MASFIILLENSSLSRHINYLRMFIYHLPLVHREPLKKFEFREDDVQDTEAAVRTSNGLKLLSDKHHLSVVYTLHRCDLRLFHYFTHFLLLINLGLQNITNIVWQINGLS